MAKIRLAIIVSHPIQYYVPLYRRLAQRDDVEIKVFFTWHGGTEGQLDRGFKKVVAWDIPLSDGYPYEVVPNTARQPGTHHFWGLRNPSLVQSVLGWQPDTVHLTGYAYASHLGAMRAFAQQNVPVLFRGDSHLLDERRIGLRWWIKKRLLSAVYAWPRALLYVGKANKEYYQAFGVPETRLFHCPHCIQVERFAEPDAEWEQQAAAWRRELGVGEGKKVLLFAGKFEDKKRPLPLMKAMLDFPLKNTILVMVGDGEYGYQVRRLEEEHPEQFRVLSFQNQSRMPVVYRLGDIFILPSAYGETWGLAVNEALACGRPTLVSNKVGCARDVIQPGLNGEIFRADDWVDFNQALKSLCQSDWRARRDQIRRSAEAFSTQSAEQRLVETCQTFLGVQ